MSRSSFSLRRGLLLGTVAIERGHRVGPRPHGVRRGNRLQPGVVRRGNRFEPRLGARKQRLHRRLHMRGLNGGKRNLKRQFEKRIDVTHSCSGFSP